MTTVTSEKRAGGPETIAAMYTISRGTLANMRSQGRGPRFYRRGRRVIYFFDDVERWLRSEPCLTIDSIGERPNK